MSGIGFLEKKDCKYSGSFFVGLVTCSPYFKKKERCTCITCLTSILIIIEYTKVHNAVGVTGTHVVGLVILPPVDTSSTYG